jgi:hypothetical protein
MHELAVTEYVFNLVKKQAEANNVEKVEKIHLLIGDQCDYVPEIIGKYLQVMSEGTPLDGVKVDVVNYRYDWIDDPVIEDGIRLASSKDIAAMKVNAVMGRGTKKDFVDVYFLLQHYSFEELIKLYLQKYTDGSEYRALLSMTYFADADPQPMPYMFQKVDWDTIKTEIKRQVEAYNRQKI